MVQTLIPFEQPPSVDQLHERIPPVTKHAVLNVFSGERSVHHENEIYPGIMSLLISIFPLSRGFVLGPQSILRPVVLSALDDLDVNSDGAGSQSDCEDMDGLSPSLTGVMHIGRGAGTYFHFLSPWDLLNCFTQDRQKSGKGSPTFSSQSCTWLQTTHTRGRS